MGIFDFLASHLMLPFLNFSYHHLYPNYGIAIILLTLAIKLAFFPLSKKQFEAMKISQKIQPEIKRIQDELKDQPEKMQAEILRVWRENKANPLGGCLPILIQLPFFFGIYRTINGDAFKAILATPGIKAGMFPFWLTNLAHPDPWFILPVVIAVSTFLSQRMMTMDPTQKAVFMFMPVIMGFISLKMPAGVLIYWAAQQIFSNIQQYIMLKPTNGSDGDAITVTVTTAKRID
ncbi:protein translocase component YidC [bacterium]|nr:protein translocase component YidC [bacterium]